ncbi:MAG: ABC transporter ATP-binding protein [Verrucomicrobia bacterium]|nr:ABC transporter ATP-binding protein [Verrucomicrobiota bacterium]
MITMVNNGSHSINNIDLINISKYISGETILSNVNIGVKQGEMTALLGPSGCGKTTTLRIIAGLERQSEGDVIINGVCKNNIQSRFRDVTMVFQRPALYPQMTVRNNIEFTQIVRKVERYQWDNRIKEIISKMGIGEIMNKRPGALSEGEKQKVAICKALARMPCNGLFDEPLSNVDAPMRREIRNIIYDVCKKYEVSSIYVTHDQDEAMSIGDKIAVMIKGTIRQIASPEQVYNQPINVEVAKYVGYPKMNIIDAVYEYECEENIIRGNTGKIISKSKAPIIRDIMKNKEIMMGIRPESIEIVKENSADDEIIHGMIKRVEDHGHRKILCVKTDIIPELNVSTMDKRAFRRGDQICVRIKKEGACYFNKEQNGKNIVSTNSE